MYSNRTLYYLNQIGIIPWINKRDYSNNYTHVSDISAPKIIILKKNTFDNKAEVLFSRIVSYLNLDKSDLLIIESLSSTPAFDEKFPMAILLLGLDSNELAENNVNCPIFNGLSLADLLKNPSEKKVVFQALHSIKALINSN